jgi:tetratricopeptide (TPR) repeat protein
MYWRQVVSQSPTTADADQAAIDHYLSVWEPLNQRILTGSSFSGNERNCCFLNMGKPGQGIHQYADVSASSALHHLDDSRSIAVTDWDHDGDLDLWITNRTSPRIRFLRNDTPTQNSYAAFQLEGLPAENCPRDAYGARVEVTFANGAGETVKRCQTLHGGDSFLSQSSKWLHFGMQPDETIQAVSVHWPGSKNTESFSGVTAGKRWRLPQSKGVAVEVPARKRENSSLEAGSLAGVPLKATGRLRINWPKSVGDLEYQSLQGQPITRKAVADRPTLYMCWASWCTPCLKELKEISQTDLGDVEIIALNIEKATTGDGPTGAKLESILDKAGFNGSRGIATLSLLGKLNQTHLDAIYVRTDLPLPVSFLVDQDGFLRVVYKGKLEVEQLKKDLQTLEVKGRDSMALSVPFPGRWSEEHLDGNPISVARVYVQDGTPDDAVAFLKHYLDITKPSDGADGKNAKVDPKTNFLRAASWYELAMMAFRGGKPDEGYANCEQALKLAPKAVPTLLTMVTHLANTGDFEKAQPYCRSLQKLAGGDPNVNFQLGRIGMGSKNFSAAIFHFENAVKANPRMFTAANNLAWILATNKDEKIRDGKRAVEVAKSVCEATQYKDYRFFSTLGAAYAENGEFENAVAITEKAIDMAKAKGDETTVGSMKKRLKQYESEKPVRD